MITRWLPRALSLIALPVVLAACDDGLSSDSAEVTLLLTDAPGNVFEAWVDIGEISLHGDAGSTLLLDESTGLVNLVELDDETLLLLEDVVVPAGTYQELRLRIDGGVLVSEDGGVFTFGGAEHPELESTGTLHCPSCSSSGLKVKLPSDVAEIEGESNIMVLDFDVAQSFGSERGNSNRWVMHPVVHATDFGVSGRVAGTVALATDVTIPECPAGTARGLGDFVPTATAETLVDAEDQPVVRSGSTADDGTFSLGFLHPDVYVMGHVEVVEYENDQLVFSATVEPTQVEVASGGQVSGVEYTIQSATCEPIPTT